MSMRPTGISSGINNSGLFPKKPLTPTPRAYGQQTLPTQMAVPQLQSQQAPQAPAPQAPASNAPWRQQMGMNPGMASGYVAPNVTPWRQVMRQPIAQAAPQTALQTAYQAHLAQQAPKGSPAYVPFKATTSLGDWGKDGFKNDAAYGLPVGHREKVMAELAAKGIKNTQYQVLPTGLSPNQVFNSRTGKIETRSNAPTGLDSTGRPYWSGPYQGS